MRHHRAGASTRYLKGMSLIELMISTTIGLIIISAAFSSYLGTAGSARMADAQSMMDEDAQAALVILSQQLRLAGTNADQSWTSTLNYATDTDITNPVYLPTPRYTAPYAPTYAPYLTPKYVIPSGPAFALSAYSLRGCSGSFSNVNTAYNLDALTCVTDTAAPDSFGVNYEADVYNTFSAGPATAAQAGAGATKVPTDCLGSPLRQIDAKIPQPASLTAPAKYDDAFYYEADNRFYIQSGLSHRPGLYCQGNGINSVAQPLVENVEDMRIAYGVMAPDQTRSTVAGYLPADQLLAQTVFPGGTTEDLRWSKVVTVRICLQMVSATPVVPGIAPASYFKCDGTLQTAPLDRRLRRTYTTTVVLRNRLL